MPSDGEVDDRLTDWLGPHVVGHAVAVVTAAIGVVGRGRLRGHLVRRSHR